MLEPLIAAKVRHWLDKPDCHATPLLAHMRTAGKRLRVRNVAGDEVTVILSSID